jgi:hypothetical protein
VHLLREPDRADDVDALADRLGGRVGIDGVLSDLDRRALMVDVPAPAPVWGFSLDRRDSLSLRWWPQGISSSADRDEHDTVAGRRLVVTTSYSKVVRGLAMGSRVTVFDVTDEHRVRYRHVLLVEAVRRPDGRADVKPVTIHAGGVVWHGPYVHVAGTARGIYTFRLEDVVAAPGGTSYRRLGDTTDGRFGGFGHRYLLPLRFRQRAITEAGVDPVRYSFLSLDRTGPAHTFIAGEYGRDQMTTRLLRLELDPLTGLPRADDEGRFTPVLLDGGGLTHMQGAVTARGRLYVTTSAGQLTRGSLWSGPPGALVEHHRVLPPGPEDICYWPATDRLWSTTEHIGARWVFCMERSRFD